MKLRFYMHIPFFLSVSLLLHSHSSSPFLACTYFVLFSSLYAIDDRFVLAFLHLLLHSGSIIFLPHTCRFGNCILRLCSFKHTSSVTLSLEHTLASFFVCFFFLSFTNIVQRTHEHHFSRWSSRRFYSCCIMHCDEL
ncbi:hypothetical protein J3E69DRAFT_201489 [Trichoderma sp. SZMC 28015]